MGGSGEANGAVAARLGAVVADTAREAIPDAVRRAAMAAIRDTVVCILAGHGREPEPAVRRLIPASGGAVPALGGPCVPSARDASFLDGTRAHALDFDDVSFAGIQHGSAVIVPTALAVAQSVGADGPDLVDAVIVGSEVAYALGLAVGPALYDSGWWPTGVLSGIGAAAAAARLMRCDARQAAHAIGIAALTVSGFRRSFGTGAKAYGVGQTAASGVAAAEAALAGIDTPVDVFEGRHGFFERFCSGVWDPSAIDRLNRDWALENPGLVVKAWPLCSCAQAAVDATIRLRRQGRWTPDRIARIDCRVTPMVADALVYDQPRAPLELLFSLPYAVALAATHGTVLPAHIADATLEDGSLRALAARVAMTVDCDIADLSRYPEAAAVRIALADGTQMSQTVRVAIGDPSNPLSSAMLDAKLQACAAPVLGAARTAALSDALAALDRPGGLTALRTLTAPVEGDPAL